MTATTALHDATSYLAQPEHERLANLERFTRCISVRFKRTAPYDRNLALLMPDSLCKSVWEYTSCAICLSDFADGEELRRVPCSGGHVFHPKCLNGWMERSHSTCPVCRGGDDVHTLRPSADALAEYIIRRMRTGKVDMSVSAENKRKAAQVVRKMREPLPRLDPLLTVDKHSRSPLTDAPTDSCA